MSEQDERQQTDPTFLDSSTTIRPGEELNTTALAQYLTTHLPACTGALQLSQFPSGFSNLTYLLRMGDREMVLRRPPFGANIRSAHDMGREYRVLSGLRRVYHKVPEPLIYCEDESVIGAPFYVMERVQGVILRAVPPPRVPLSPSLMQQLSLAAIDTLAEIHGLDVAAAGLADLGRPAGYVERQLRGWQRRYEAAETTPLPLLDEVITWLNRRQPPSQEGTLIHNDFKYDNLVLAPSDLTQVLAVLDWEMCTLGDPLMDLGTTLGYWIEANDPPSLIGMFGLTALPGNLDRGSLVLRYQEVSERTVSDPLFYYVYGLFKIAVIIQQIYHRYRTGNTQDARFAQL
ncbi:MAG: phosphotransferase family protein, partial [Caldilineaceae bacterium]|nr:phosphotransferase family protein [Caldilineaceae bacterium]